MIPIPLDILPHIDGSMEERRNSSALAMELRIFCTNSSALEVDLRLSCTNPSIYDCSVLAD